MTEVEVEVRRELDAESATKLIGERVGTDLVPTIPSPRDGSRVRFVDEEGETVALITRLSPDLRHRLRAAIVGVKYGQNVARQGRGLSVRGVTFGYAPPKVMARQEGCRATAFDRDNPSAAALISETAETLSREFEALLPAQATADRDTVRGSVLADWRLGESTWTSGVINQANVLPYHRDGNNLETWSAMPTFRLGMRGGHLHVPEYGIVFPCGDGDVTWFYGRGLVHGVTPMWRPKAHRGKGEAYRYSMVFYALRGMTNCATYAEETANVAAKRTARERAEVAKIRSEIGLDS